jgi:regulatory protein
LPPVAVPSAKERALRLLAVRSRSREELRKRLGQAGMEAGDIETALDDLEAVGLVDDEKFARELAAHQLNRRGAGRRLAIAAVRRAGVDPRLAERVVDESAPADEEARAEEVARSRVNRLAGLDQASAHRRLLSFLLRRGYEGDTARAAVRRVLATAHREPQPAESDLGDVALRPSD